MRIFFYSTVFAPSVGGIEAMAEMLCREFTTLGHEVVLVTRTTGEGEFPFAVKRNPPMHEIVDLARWCDIQIQANVSLKAAWIRCFAFRRTIYRHGNVYQRDDGTRGLVDWLKTGLSHATPSIANSNYTANLTGAKHIILNAYDDSTFGPAPDWESKDRDLVFLGRLVSQKGCNTLIDAIAHLVASGLCPSLTVIGDGPDRRNLERQAEELGLSQNIRFVGKMRGGMLADELGRHRFMVVPSNYEEPFGIVALEGLACGCVPVVSGRGGLVDAISGHGFTFPNGDDVALADVLEGLLRKPDAAHARLKGVESHLGRCTARSVAEQYLEVFRQETGAT